MSDARPKYDPRAIEPERQAAWEAAGVYDTPSPEDGRPAVYVKPSSPFTSGNLHMGHVRDYSIGDAYARYRRALGDTSCSASASTPSACRRRWRRSSARCAPADWVVESGERMLEQMKRLGYSFDYDRVFYSSDESQYRWSQWLFVTLLEAGLVYRADTTVDWCDHCQTTLAALQVEDGRCWRCHNQVRLIRRPTWFLKVGPYLEENDRNLEGFAELGRALAQNPALHPRPQRRGRGSSSRTPTAPRSPSSPRTPGRVAEATFVLVSPRHPEVERWTADPAVAAQLDELRSGGWERSARDAKAVPLIDTGASLTVPGGGELPVVVSPIADARYGPTAALGIPTADEADEAIAAPDRADRRRAARRPRLARRRGMPPATGRPTSRSAASATGGRRSRSSTATSAGPCRSRSRSCRSSSRATSSRPGRATRWPSGRTSSTSIARAAATPPSARPTPSTATSTRSGSGCRRRSRPRPAPSRCSATRTCAAGCPPSASSPATTAAASSSTSGS